MQAEVIAIGDELTSGQRLDTNSQWLSQQLGELGIRVLFHTTVGDDLAASCEAFRLAISRADVVVVSGGLGPTADDLTRQALAEALQKELVLDEAALAHIQSIFLSRRGAAMPERNRVQALFPEGSTVIANPHGTAPGIYYQCPRAAAQGPAHVFCLPGVPAEMREMWAGTVQPRLREVAGSQRRTIRHYSLKCFGVGESDLEQMLPDLIARGRTPTVGITVSQATITLRITAIGSDESACWAQIEPVAETIRQCLGNLVFGEGDDELQEAVVRLLVRRGQSLASVEWGPGGLLALWLSGADTAGVYRAGQVRRDLEATAAGLSDRVAEAAEAVRRAADADWGLAIGPFPAPDSGGRVELALAGATGVLRQAVRFSGHPDILNARCTKQALNLLRLHLLNAEAAPA